MMKRGLKCRDKGSWTLLFKTYIRSHLEYCVQAWRPWRKSDEKDIERVQKRALRQINGFKDLTYKQRLTEAGLTTMAERRERGDLIEAYKQCRGLSQVRPGLLYDFVNPGLERVTRQSTNKWSMKQHKMYSNLKCRQNSFGIRIPPKWNKVKKEIQNSQSLNQFKNALDRWSANDTAWKARWHEYENI